MTQRERTAFLKAESLAAGPGLGASADRLVERHAAGGLEDLFLRLTGGAAVRELKAVLEE